MCVRWWSVYRLFKSQLIPKINNSSIIYWCIPHKSYLLINYKENLRDDVWISQFDRKSLWSVSQPLTIIVIQHKQLKSTVLLSLLLLAECESCKTARFNWVSQNVLERLDKTTKQYENTSYFCKTWRIDFYLLGLYSDQPKNAQMASLVNQK